MKRLFATSLALAFSASAGLAEGVSTCSDLRSPVPIAGYSYVELEQGDRLDFGNSSMYYCVAVYKAKGEIYRGVGFGNCVGSFTAPADGDYFVDVINLYYEAGKSSQDNPKAVGEQPPNVVLDVIQPVSPPPMVMTYPTMQCTPGSAGEEELAQSQATAAGAGTSTNAIEEAIDNAAEGAGAARLTANGVFLSTQGKHGSARAWGSLHARQFNGDVDGKSIEFTLGVDTLVGPNTRMGLILSKGRSDLDVNSIDVEIDSLSFGPYVTHKLSDTYELSAFLVVSEPKFDIDGTDYTAKRVGGGIKFDADYSLGTTEVNSYASLTGFSEKHPDVTINGSDVDAHEVTSVVGKIGTRAIFNAGQPLRPYLGVGVDFRKFDDGIDDMQEFASPRVNAGLSYKGEAGTFALDLSGGRILEDTRDTSMRISYQLDF